MVNNFKRKVKEYVNQGVDTVNLAVPKVNKPLTRAQGRLQIHNEVIPIDETIETFTRTKKVPYNQVEYKKKYIPPEFKDPTPVVRRSERITPVATRPTTRWTASKTRKAMSVNGRLITLPSSIQAEPIRGLIDQPLILDDRLPLSTKPSHEKLRAYHTRLDLMQAMLNPDEADMQWQVESVLEWKYKPCKSGKQVMIKLTWIGGDKQWMTLDDLRLHDPFLLIRYALKNKLTDKTGWEWSKYYLQSDQILNNMVNAYKVSSFQQNIKFGVEVPRSTRHALKIDAQDGTNLWKEAMRTKIN